MQRRIEQTLTDVETGEVLEGFDLVAVPRRRARFSQEFVQMFQDGMIKLATEADLTKTQMRVLWYLLGRLDYENYVHVPQTEIAEKLKLPKANVSKALRVLSEKRILVRGPKTGRTATWQLAQHYGWKGKVTAYNKRRLELVQDVPPAPTEAAPGAVVVDDSGVPAHVQEAKRRFREQQLDMLERLDPGSAEGEQG